MLASLTAAQIAKGDRVGYCAGRTWCYAVLSHDVHAYALWGVPEVQEVDALLALWDAFYASMPSHAVLADMRALESVGPRAFAAFLAYFRSNGAALHAIVTNACVLLNESLTGSIAAGFFGIVPAPFPVSNTTSLEDAARRLGLGETALAAYEHLRQTLQHADSLVARLRRLLDDDLATPDASAAAKSLGMSERTLQRRLGAIETSFSEQVSIARIARARVLIESTGDSFTQIALAVGFASLEQFSRTFRAQVGQTPTEYRGHSPARTR